MSTGIVLFGHGARDPRWADTIEALAARVAELAPRTPVQTAFLEFMTPDLATAVDALVAQEAIDRVEVGSPARFHRRGDWMSPITGTVEAIEGTRARTLPHRMLATEHGGRVPTLRQTDGCLVSCDGLCRMRLHLAAAPPEPVRGAVAAAPCASMQRLRNMLVDGARDIAAVLVRESGL
jgi:sirohydrochlorin cobaltochelatase